MINITDAQRYAWLLREMRLQRGCVKVMEYCPTFGEEERISDLSRFIDAKIISAINNADAMKKSQ